MFHFQEWIVAHGCLGIFLLLMLGVFGLPIPDEPLLIFSGYLIFQKKLHPFGVLLASFLGSAVGISISYLVGRVLGLRLVCLYGHFVGLNPQRLRRVHDWFRGMGHWIFVLGYFVPGVRHITAIVAGVSKWELAPFMLFAYSGAFVWVSTFLCIGYFFAERWGHVAETIHQNLVLVSCAVGVVVTLWLASRFLSSRRAC
jgi:membrane protein DedA with SNARE-associated domain